MQPSDTEVTGLGPKQSDIKNVTLELHSRAADSKVEQRTGFDRALVRI